MISQDRPVFIKHSESDQAMMVHDVASGRLVMVRRDPPLRGATVKDSATFKLRLEALPYTDGVEHDAMPASVALILGMVIGASCMGFLIGLFFVVASFV